MLLEISATELCGPRARAPAWGDARLSRRPRGSRGRPTSRSCRSCSAG